MVVYNIRKALYAKALTASGVANRWNKNDEYVIYAGSSISLSVLELVAHRNAIQINEGYKLLSIHIDADEQDITRIEAASLPGAWQSIQSYPILQKLGSAWYQSFNSLLLEVPSVLVPRENNYLIHTRHPAFREKVSILQTEDFTWDKRLL